MWNLSFPPSDSEIEKFRLKQQSVISTLQKISPDKFDSSLKSIEKSLIEAQSVGELNGVRSNLVAEFNAYATGKEFFGPKLGDTVAEAGEYLVIVKTKGQSVETRIRVRKDPIFQEGVSN